jgi:putative membrane protein insertion efficiency factor
LKLVLNILKYIISLPFLAVIFVYKYLISPFTPPSCRHYPTCSTYAGEAIKMHGPLLGGWLAVRRIGRCHPWGTHGHDPVPPKGSVIEIKVLKLKIKS